MTRFKLLFKQTILKAMQGKRREGIEVEKLIRRLYLLQVTDSQDQDHHSGHGNGKVGTIGGDAKGQHNSQKQTLDGTEPSKPKMDESQEGEVIKNEKCSCLWPYHPE